MPSTDPDKIIKSILKHAIADPETRNQLLSDDEDMTLDQLVKKAQQFEDFRSSEAAKPKKSLRTMDRSSETSQLNKQIEELQKEITSLQSGQKGSFSSQRRSFIC